jgi:hypothetical protein
MKTMSPKPPEQAKPDAKAAAKAAPAPGNSPRQNLGAAPGAPNLGRRVQPSMRPAVDKTPEKPPAAKRPAP